jgi:hypothetical protein
VLYSTHTQVSLIAAQHSSSIKHDNLAGQQHVPLTWPIRSGQHMAALSHSFVVSTRCRARELLLKHEAFEMCFDAFAQSLNMHLPSHQTNFLQVS